MISRRLFAATAAASVALIGIRGVAAADAAAEPVGVIKSLYDTLLDTMKNGPTLGFDGRYQKLEPAIHQAFDVATMCKIAIGPAWTSMPTDKKNALLVAFDKYLVSTYAARFRKFSGQQFQVGAAKQAPGDRMLVESKLVKSDGEPIELNYLMRKNETGWQVIDIYLAGAISQMTQMRSDFSEPLHKGGVDALIQQLDQKSKELQAEA
ncbi:MAG TPA: ABC transporter substrate-binding protein [Dongiaceae bacterium]|jgi:phospholipid transport system substrate-binding protein|nr:ABC transporter substrate-binding protein [Dongiaceae bacterium]